MNDIEAVLVAIKCIEYHLVRIKNEYFIQDYNTTQRGFSTPLAEVGRHMREVEELENAKSVLKSKIDDIQIAFVRTTIIQGDGK